MADLGDGVLCNGAGYVSGVEAAKLIAAGAAKLATQEAAKLTALLVETDARLFGQVRQAPVVRFAPGRRAGRQEAAKLIAPGAAKLATC